MRARQSTGGEEPLSPGHMKLPSTCPARPPFSLYSPTFIKSKNKTSKTSPFPPLFEICQVFPLPCSGVLLSPGGSSASSPRSALTCVTASAHPALLKPWGRGPQRILALRGFPSQAWEEGLRVGLFFGLFVCVLKGVTYALLINTGSVFFHCLFCYQNLFLKALPARALKKCLKYQLLWII